MENTLWDSGSKVEMILRIMTSWEMVQPTLTLYGQNHPKSETEGTSGSTNWCLQDTYVIYASFLCESKIG